MTHDERVHALMLLGFSKRQASFLVLVMLHSGVCLARQYCTHARIVRGQKSHQFFTTLVAEGLATANHTAHRGTFLYHLHGKRLYRAIGEPDHRHRRPVTLARAIERLMVLDGMLAEPETVWLATPHQKVEHFTRVTSLSLETLPGRRVGQEGLRRPFPDALPIGWARDDRPYVFLYLVTGENPLDFRASSTATRNCFGTSRGGRSDCSCRTAWRQACTDSWPPPSRNSPHRSPPRNRPTCGGMSSNNGW
jgi:hypothetical protein